MSLDSYPSDLPPPSPAARRLQAKLTFPSEHPNTCSESISNHPLIELNTDRI